MNLLWYMRGSIDLKQGYDLTPDQRKKCYEIIKRNAELSKDSGRLII